jgi:hypothetical protein
VLRLVSLTEERAIYLALELDRSWTEIDGVNPLDGTNYLDTASAFIEGFLHLLAGGSFAEVDRISQRARVFDKSGGHGGLVQGSAVGLPLKRAEIGDWSGHGRIGRSPFL